MKKLISIGTFVIALVAGLMQATPRGQAAQAPQGWAGAYSDAQAGRGEKLYGGNCAACHGPQLLGGDRAPAVAGPAFVARWQGKTLNDLVDYVYTQMPLHGAGALARQQSADIVAFMLKKTGVAAGTGDLNGGSAGPATRNAGELKATGYYTKAQAIRGKTAFNRNCAFCHTVDKTLFSEENNKFILPRTFGGRFVERVYHGQVLYPTVYHLFSKLQSMPAFNTKSISEQVRADILAYILENNDLPAGDEELTPEPARMKNMILGEKGFQSLFNGKDFTGMKFVVNPNCTAQPDGCGQAVPSPDLIHVENGEIVCQCNVHGYFYWDKPYGDFTFRFEQKFEKPADWDPSDKLYFGGTGALIFITPPHRTFPRSVEIEGRYYDFGEPFLIGGKGKVQYDHGAWMKVATPVGAWDKVEIASKAGVVKTYINGALVSTLSDHDYKPGPIGMQLEGAPVRWRNLRVKVE